MKDSRLYICVRHDVPDYIVPTLVAHTVLRIPDHFTKCVPSNVTADYDEWYSESFKKCVVRVNEKEWIKVCNIPHVFLGYENTTLNGDYSCAIPPPVHNYHLPNVLKFAKLWAPIPPQQEVVVPPKYIGPFDVERMRDTLAGDIRTIPSGLNREEKRQLS